MKAPAWFRKRWVPAWEHEAVLGARAGLITSRNELSAQHVATCAALAKETAASRAAEGAPNEQMEASRLVRGSVTKFRTVDGQGRILRLNVVIDDRVLYAMRDTLLVREALIREALYKVERGIRTLDFTLAIDLVKEEQPL